MEETTLYQTISNNSDKFAQPAFGQAVNSTSNPKWIGLASGNIGAHACTAQISGLICPSFSGDRLVDVSTAPGTSYLFFSTAANAPGVAMTNYNLYVGTDIRATIVTGAGGTNYVTPMQNGAMALNGTPASTSNYYGSTGSRLSGMVDGTSKTVLSAETKERWFGSWLDGTMNWLVAARNMDPTSGTALTPPVVTYGGVTATAGWPTASSPYNTAAYAGRLVPNPTASPAGGHAINVGSNPPASIYYIPASMVKWPDQQANPRRWGPSSDHGGSIVNHLFGDGHVQQVTDSIDPAVYYWIVTRNGAEPFDSDAVR
jgi:prepilin-type processing-associated H-X9-DG protein